MVSEPLEGLGFDYLNQGPRVSSYIQQSSMYSYRKHDEKAEQPATRKLLQGKRKEIKIPLFYGEFDPDTYPEWEKDVDFLFNFHNHTEEKKLHLATTGLRGYAFDWWYQIANNRKRCGELQISSWYEMKSVMKKRFVAKRYGQTDLERLPIQSRSSQARVRLSREEPQNCYDREAQRKPQLLQTHLDYLDNMQSTQFKENLRNMIAESLTAVTKKKPQQRPVPRPASGDDELTCYQKAPVEEKEKIAAKPAVKIPEIEPALAIPFQGEHSAIQLQLEEHVPGALCGLIHDQNKVKEEEELDEALVVHKELLETLIEQGGFIRSFSCDLLIQPFVCVQFNLVEHLRFFKGLQHFVFEPGGSFSVSIRSNNNLVQKTISYKLDLQGFFTPEKQDLRSNLFEGREDGVILSICSKNRGETGGNTPLIRPITDQNQLRSTKQKLAVVKKMPKLENEYGDQTTRPPDQKDVKLRVHGLMFMRRTWVRSSWREAFNSKLNKVEKSSALEVICSEESSKMLLRHEEGLQSFVFHPGETREVMIYLMARSGTLELNYQGSIILQSLDLRTNPFKGGGDGVILIRIGINGLKPMYGSAIPLIMVQFNGQYHTLIGMIYEVLDREKRRTVGTALKRLEQRGFNQLSLTGAMETIHLVQICMENKENMSGSFWVGLYLDLGEIRLFRSKKRVAARILIHLLSSWPNRTWRI